MKIICKQENLNKALNIVGKAISQTSALAITRGILIKTEEDTKISLSGTDIQFSIKTGMNAIVQEHGGVVVSARRFADIIRKLPAGDIVISTDEKNGVKIKTEHSDFDLAGIEEEEFPRIESGEDGEKISIDKNSFREMIAGTAFAASLDESRGIITGLLYEIGGEEMTMVALDGYRVAIRQKAAFGRGKEKIVLPARTMKEVAKILSDIEEEEKVDLFIGERKAKIEIGSTMIRLNLLEGEYIKYRDVVPKDNQIKVVLNRKELSEAVERAAMMKSENKSAFVRFSVTDELLVVSSRAEDGKAREEVSIVKTGEDLEIGFDARFVTDALKAIDDEKIVLEFNTSVSPCLIKPEEGENYLYIILPVRLSTIQV
ncbi:MAG: DNA polymerase III subunit beta [Clostridiales Family XIII bacterium]|jgi:DNA polymerase-3 subunit beta|nr:DNA polymerase III subunit beta [Clostridiales Family XIII bacterium]